MFSSLHEEMSLHEAAWTLQPNEDGFGCIPTIQLVSTQNERSFSIWNIYHETKIKTFVQGN